MILLSIRPKFHKILLHSNMEIFGNSNGPMEMCPHDEIYEVLKKLPPADFALLNSAKSGGGLVLILTNLTAGYNLSRAS